MIVEKETITLKTKIKLIYLQLQKQLLFKNIIQNNIFTIKKQLLFKNIIQNNIFYLKIKQ